MPFFPNLPDDAGVRHILALNPAAGRALIEFHRPVRSATGQDRLWLELEASPELSDQKDATPG